MHPSLKKTALGLSALVLLASFIFADTWEQTTTADFNTTGSAAVQTQVINDSVQLGKQADWWDPAANWPGSMSDWQYRRAISIYNGGSVALSNYQIKVENPVFDDTGLVGSWHFDESTGTSAGDMSSYGNGGTLISGPLWSSGTSDGCLLFDGVDDYVSVPNNSAYTGSCFTIALFYKSTAVDPIVWQRLIGKGPDATETYAIWVNPTGDLGGVNAQIGGAQYGLYGTTDVADQAWHFLVATYDGSVLRFFVDGVLEASQSISGALASNSEILAIGKEKSSSSDNYPTNGRIDEVKVYVRALTQGEILCRYNSGNPKMSHNYRDIRFTDLSGGPLSYWMEKDGCFWVKIPSVPVGTSQIIVCYGNSAAANAESYAGTFPEIYGDGSNGELSVVSGTFDMNAQTNGYNGRIQPDAVNYSTTGTISIGATAVTLASSPSGLVIGDEALIVNLQGSTGDNGKVGNYETRYISGIVGNTLTFDGALTKDFGDSATQKIMVQRIPHYTNVTVSSGSTLTASAYNGSKNGVLFFRADGTVTVQGTVDMKGKGYRGGNVGGTSESYNSGYTPYAGESYHRGVFQPIYNTNHLGGGSGGFASNGEGMTGGFGGGHGTGGSNGVCAWTSGTAYGGAGITYGTSNIGRIFFGSGGGEGSNYWNSGPGAQPAGYGSGGVGGGVIFIAAPTISNSNTITAKGNNGQNGYLFTNNTSNISGGGGGGGAGGSICLIADTITAATTDATGGSGGTATATAYNTWSIAPVGGSGGSGRIRVDCYGSLNGSTNPTPGYSGKSSPVPARRYASPEPTCSIGSEAPNDSQYAWASRQLITVNATDAVQSGYSVKLDVDLEAMRSAGDVDNDLGDLRIVAYDRMGLVSCELDREIVRGQGLCLNAASSQYINTGDVFDSLGDMTYEFWAKRSSLSGAQYVLSKGYTNFAFAFNTAAHTGVIYFADGLGGYTPISFTPGVDTTAWNHYAVTKSGTTVALYVNGALVFSGTYAIPGALPNTTYNFNIGRDSQGANSYFSGIIDEVRISNNVRYAANFKPQHTPYALDVNTLGLWHFDGNAYDSSDAGNNGTPSGSPYYTEGKVVKGNGIASELVGTENGLSLLYHLSSGAQTVTDSSVNGNNGTLGPTTGAESQDPTAIANGKLGGALSFDGANDFVKIASPTGGSLNPLNAISLEAWVYWQGAGTGTPYVFSKGWGDVYEMTINSSNGKVSFRVVNDWSIPGNQAVVTSNTGLVQNKWYHVAGTYDKNIGYLRIYIDGELENSTAFSMTMMQSSLQVKLGSNYQGGEDANTSYWMMFKGRLDEAAIYNRSLTAGEVRQHASAKSEIWFKTRSAINASSTSEASGQHSYFMYCDSDSLGAPLENKSNVYAFFAGFETGMDGFNAGTRGAVLPAEGSYSLQLPNGYSFGSTMTYPAAPYMWEMKTWIANTTAQHFQPQLAYGGKMAAVTPDYPNAGFWGRFGNSTGTVAWYNSGIAVTNKGAWHDIKIMVANDANNTYSAYDGNTVIASGIYANYSSGSVLNLWGGAGITEYVDMLKVRPYTTNEPTLSLGVADLPYDVSGTFVSAAKDIGADDTRFDLVSWTVAGAGILTMEVRADNSDPAGWGSSDYWEDVDNGDTAVAVTGRYLQYRATFTGDGMSSEPALLDVTLAYTVPIVPPLDSVSCNKLSNYWYPTATFVFSNDLGFELDINTYYYSWDENATYSFIGSELQWNSGDLSVNSTTDGSWYFHYLPVSSTDTEGTAQDLGPFKFDGTVPSTVVLTAPLADENVTDAVPTFSWGAIVDTSGVTYTLQVDKYTAFLDPHIQIGGSGLTSYSLSGNGTEFLDGNTIYYWRVRAVDGAGNASTSSVSKITTSASVPKIVNSTSGVSYPDLQSAVDSVGTAAGDVIGIGDSISYDVNLMLTKDVVLEKAILSPAAGFAVTGQGSLDGEVLRNCVITAGGISNLALGQNLTIYGTDPGNPVVLENSKLVNCAIKLGTTITNCTLENCFIEAAATHFADVTTGDFHPLSTAIDLVDKGMNLSSDFAMDKDGEPRGVNVFEIANFDATAWDIGAYEFQLDSAYPTPGPGPATPPNAPTGLYPLDGTEWLLDDVTVTWFCTGASATGYTLEWGTDPALASGVTTVSSIVVQSYNIESLPKDVIIYWRVKASNTYGDSAWSAIASFSTNYGELAKLAPATPATVYPAADATGVSSDTVFMWEYEGVALPTSYTVEWGTDPDMATGLSTMTGIADAAYQIDDLPLETAVYWHVKALNAYGESEWSATSSFTTSGEALFFADPDELSFSMAANQVTPEKKSFKILCGIAGVEDWTVAVTDGWMTASPMMGSFADAKVSTIEISISPFGLTIGQTYIGAVTVALDDGSNEIAIPVYLEVTAVVDDGDTGGGDGGSTDLIAPTLVSPADGQGAFDAEPYLVWAASTGATGYIVQVGRDAEFTLISVSQEVSLTQYLPPALDKGISYYWRVKALNEDKISEWSATRWFALNPAEEDSAKKSCFLGAIFD